MTTAANPALTPSLADGLHDLFGLDEFRSGQKEIMSAVIEGDDALVIMPTGAGKSLCYQLPAFALDGVTLVVSPLIALMKDQVDALTLRGLPASFINSSISTGEQRERIAAMESGLLKLVYVAPERFQNRAFTDALRRVEIGLFAIDEAHCISQWGHDFRPEYRRLGEVRRELGEPVTMALTATATPAVQEDILDGLGLDTAQLFVRGFERPNLFFEVFSARGHDAKIQRIQALTAKYEGQSAVVYCATRKQVDQVADDLGADVGRYHGGMSDRDRDEAQDAWMRGDTPILVATNAFGMGVDKPDVRAVVHYNLPGSLEAYYQEAGRAGRDGREANCLLLFNHADRGIHEFFTDTSFPSRDTVVRIWDELRTLGAGTHPTDAAKIARKLKGVHVLAVETVFRSLRYHGHIEFGTRTGQGWLAVNDVPASDLRIDWGQLETRRRIAQRQLQDVVEYASVRACRPAQIVRYFGGEPSFGESCDSCDGCNGPPPYAAKMALESARTIRTADPLDIVLKKVLAGVARTKGRWGAHVIAGHLRGSRAKKILKAGLDRLSTHGVLSALKQDDIVHLLDVAERHALLVRNQHGAVKLTELGGEVMRDDADVPPALQAVLEATITTRGSTRGSKSTSSASRKKSTASPSTDSEVGATCLQTWEHLEQGRPFDEIARRRGLTMGTVMHHMLRLAAFGYEVDTSGNEDDELYARVREAASDWSFGDPLKPLMEALDSSCTYTALQFNLIRLLNERRATA